MKRSSTLTDNLLEVLSKIVEFTEQRHQILTENITHAHSPGYVPRDLDVEGFAILMAGAVEEHVRHDRLVLVDTPTIRFGAEGRFETTPLVDDRARQLLQSDPKAYLKDQIEKLAENLLNAKIARGLMERKQQRALER